MNTIVLTFIAFLLSAAAAIHGMIRFFHKGRPMYFQLMICAVTCFALTQLWYLVAFLCGNPGGAGIGLLGYAGCNLFLLSGNYGQLDLLVDDRGVSGVKARKKAYAAPVIMALLLILFITSCIGRISTFDLVYASVIILSSLPASYFSLKHILLPEDESGFLRASKACNVAALLSYPVECLCLMILLCEKDLASGLLNVLIGLIMVALVISSERGMKVWKTLI